MIVKVFASHSILSFAERAAIGGAAVAILASLCAPTAVADPTTATRAAIDAARSEAGCPPLQSDPVLDSIATRVTHEVSDYVRHDATSFPTTGEVDPVTTGSGGVLRLMREAGYNTNRAKLLSGYGDPRMGGKGDIETKAVKAAILEGQGFEVFSDCRYNRYGASAVVVNDGGGQGWPSSAPRNYAVAQVLVAG